ncbi:MAG TPA: hypothetical protein VKE98_13410 [Gemmataceae bacterium]|nr:hypothetical protein [Gemmataceae bacterium]
MMHVECDCGRRVFVPAHQAGQKVICSGCGAELQAPGVPFIDHAGRSCPLCGCRNWTKIIKPTNLNRILASRTGDFKEYTNFIFSLPRECRECGTIWFPPTAKWAVFLTLVFGVILLGTILFVLVPNRPPGDSYREMILMGLGAGVLMVVLSFLALTGKIGKATIVAIGKTNDQMNKAEG